VIGMLHSLDGGGNIGDLDHLIEKFLVRR